MHILKTNVMGNVDIEQEVDEILRSDLFYWDGKNPSYEELQQIVRNVVTEVTESHYSMNDGEIDDWDMWEQDIRIALNDIFDDE